MSYILRYMVPEDVARLTEIDRQSFPLPWSAKTYLYEIVENQTSHMVLIEDQLAIAGGPAGWFRRLLGRDAAQGDVIGFGGMWVISGEAHISIVAVHPNYRRQHFGEVLVNRLLHRALVLGADTCVLEVRAGNEAAQRLYIKYGFEVTGRRKKYYRDNAEDALIMIAGPLDAVYRAKLVALTDALNTQVQVSDLLELTAPIRAPSINPTT